MAAAAVASRIVEVLAQASFVVLFRHAPFASALSLRIDLFDFGIQARLLPHHFPRQQAVRTRLRLCVEASILRLLSML